MMQTYCLLLDGSNNILEAYAGPSGGAPAGAVTVTAAIFAALPVGLSGWQYSGGELVAPIPPSPTLAQEAAAALSAGLTITLSGTLSLAATLFPVDPVTQTKLAAVITYVDTEGTFFGGATSWSMKDSSGAWHSFTISQYKAVAAAIAAYVATLLEIIDGNPAVTALPANSVSLTV